MQCLSGQYIQQHACQFLHDEVNDELWQTQLWVHLAGDHSLHDNTSSDTYCQYTTNNIVNEYMSHFFLNACRSKEHITVGNSPWLSRAKLRVQQPGSTSHRLYRRRRMPRVAARRRRGKRAWHAPPSCQ
jgi:hypothetical protein